MEPALADYALIGNCRAAALVSKYGSIDWCCLPEFDSPSIFAALLDRRRGGYFTIRPMGGYQSAQSYIADTNVVETYFSTDTGEVRLTDAFTAMGEKEKANSIFPDHEILRMVECVSGNVRMMMECAPRPCYGKYIPDLKNHKKLGVRFEWKENIFTLLNTVCEEVNITGGDHTVASVQFSLDTNERQLFSLSYSNQSPAILPELALTGPTRMKRTISFWKEWITRCNYVGVYEQEVKRSALVL